jgi:uncharacterized protein YeaO (DUF488 family)
VRNEIKIKRAYEKPDKEDGLRILVDRLWPRGLTKEKANIDLWLKDIAPSSELRKWFGHDPDRWDEFRNRYYLEIKKNEEPGLILRDHLSKGVVTLVYAAKDEEHNGALALKELFESRFPI